MWISTRKAGDYLSRTKPLDADAKAQGIQESTIVSFERALTKCPQSSASVLYRGVFLTDVDYLELIRTKTTTTKRHYSFAKRREWAEAFGNKIVLVLNVNDATRAKTWDISRYSRESEVILARGTRLCLTLVETRESFTYLYLNVCG